ncbi:superfamily II DNA or RNA helicase [Microbacteriaceae bacterium SG_E_30_P1]|uniref:Superfamily II DNA or RNA helicase n=1 Tax=Antiquaquibacter oligotrophicus TaxID=2880260 RepID=A0ABT6KTA8_9MICO|nr:helicase-related protein [Antiquaquibacter oligotrophicus]MDH6182432.1 superfamily II DNA or RNA helicase [Antiquaquibacter oligotrophicus]UDF14597.1 DEAD/DEAH box helicase family protein [Antiquaquibacter oligotrophicus]
MAESSQTWTPDPGLVREVEEQFERAIASYKANPNLVGEHANHEESIRVGGYANRTLLELVQNAADAMAGTDLGDVNLGRVEIVLDPDSRTLYCANSGRPFSKNGLIAITHAHLSGKRGDEIGRFGLGFKSVLAVTDSPQVVSRSVSFEFNSRVAKEAIMGIGSAARRLPVLRTATLLDASALIAVDPIVRELSEWATTIIRLPEVTGLNRLRAEMENFSSEFLLFVGAVREVRLRVLGEQGIKTSHVSRDMGEGRFKIERPDGGGDEWFVGERMHSPSQAARREVGEAVSRDEIKVSVAIPARYSQQRVGRFWSYFPLHDETSASGLFNAPWSVNDDRTTLLRNDYNREILTTLAEIFVEMLPRVSTTADPAALLDYLPARGREAIYFGDEVLCALVPRLAVNTALIPDALGRLRIAPDLRPLDFEWEAPEIAHEAWIASPNTADDVPHWRCYGSSQRFARLRQLFAVSVDPDRFDDEGRDLKRALEMVPKRGILSWLREWAEGDDVESAANALKFVIGHRGKPEVAQARVIPTNDGFRALNDRSLVFLEQAEDLEIEGAVFVAPEFLAYPGIQKILRDAGFRDLDPVAILHARIARLTSSSDSELQAKFWDAVLGVSQKDAVEAIKAHPGAAVLVPTRNGGWAWPQQVVDLDETLPDADGAVLLDRQRCLPNVAHALGVVDGPKQEFSLDDEFAFDRYQDWALAEINSRLTPGDRAVERISMYPSRGSSQGPFSVLLLLRDAGAAEQTREAWTRGLLEFGDAPWDCEDTASGLSYRVKSPVRWAVEQAGLLRTSRGFRPPTEIVAPSLVQYRDLLPLFEGSRGVVEALGLPDELDRIPAGILKDALDVELLPSAFSDALLVDFVITATRLAYAGGQPARIPARVGRIIESRPTRTVYVAVSDEQRDYLAQHQRPYLKATQEQAEALVQIVGCLRFEDSFAFSVRIDGQQGPEHLLDVFTGLRGIVVGDELTNATLVRAAAIAKWVTTEDGVETQSLEWHREGLVLTVGDTLDERRTLAVVSEAFELGLTNADIERVLKVGLDHHLELLRQEALSAATDAERLDAYFGEDDLREKLPRGLWQGLEAQGLLSPSTSVSELCLSVYGKDTIKELADLFRVAGFPDVPAQWAGGGATVSWLRRMGFGAEFAGQRTQHLDAEFIVPGATVLNDLHGYQREISVKLRKVLLENSDGRRSKAMVVLPTGAGKTRVATQTILELFIDGSMVGPVLWIAQSQELCEQAVQTFSTVWRGLGDERPVTIGRLWDTNREVHQPDTQFSVIVATDAKLEAILGRPSHAEYDWLREASAVFVDEGHVAGNSTRYTQLFSWLGVDGRSWERPLVGLSATPFKGTSVEATKALAARFGNNPLQAFSTDPYSELVELGVLARVKHEVLQGADLTLTAAEADEARRKLINQKILDKIAADNARMGILVESIMNLDSEWSKSVLVFTPNVLSAQVLAATLRFREVKAASVSGQTGRQERRDVIERFKRGEIQVLANCDLLTQGFDAPGVSALYIARPTFSPNAYIQMAGRGLRGPKNGGKDECLIVDMADNFGSSDINNLLGFREYEELWQEQRS